MSAPVSTRPSGSTDASPLFEFEDVSVVLDDVQALVGVTLGIPDHGVTAILGPSGSGKSTLLRLCNRLEVPTSGQVSYRGRALDDLDPRQLRRQVGMVFQRPVVFGGTVRDNLLVGDPDGDDASHRTALERAALDPSLTGRDASTLSGGEAQRLGLARTLATDPAVLLLDEPTSALDATPRLAFERTIRRLADAGIPVLWVTHDLDQVQRVADRVVVLDHGRVILDAADVASATIHPSIATLYAPDADHPEVDDGDR